VKAFSSILVLIVLVCGATVWANNSNEAVIQFTVQGTEPLGYDAIFGQEDIGVFSTSTANLFSGGGTFYQDARTTDPILSVGFVGLTGTFDGVTFDPTGVALAVTPAAGTDILTANKSFSTVFGEPEQNFIDDIRTPISGLSFAGRNHWLNAEGSHIPYGVQGTLIYFPVASGAPESGGTFQANVQPDSNQSAPEPGGIAIIALLSLPILLARRRICGGLCSYLE